MRRLGSIAASVVLIEAVKTGAWTGLCSGLALLAAVVGLDPSLRLAGGFAVVWVCLVGIAVLLILASIHIIGRTASMLGPRAESIPLLRLIFHAGFLSGAAALAMGTGLSMAWALDGLREPSGPESLPMLRLLLLAVLLGISVGFLLATYRFISGTNRMDRLTAQDTLRVGGLLLVYSIVLGMVMGSPVGVLTGALPAVQESARGADLGSLAILLGLIPAATALLCAVLGTLTGFLIHLGSSRTEPVPPRRFRLLVTGLTAGCLAVMIGGHMARSGQDASLILAIAAALLILPMTDAILRSFPRGNSALSRGALMLVLALLTGTLAAQSPAAGEEVPHSRWLPLIIPAPVGGQRVHLAAYDGLDWNLLRPMIRRGEMPALDRIAAGGLRGPLEGLPEEEPPAVWGVVATGHSPERHGTSGFQQRILPLNRRALEPFPELLRIFDPLRLFPTTLTCSQSRRVPALWDIADGAGLRSLVVGAWQSWPVDPIQGAMVSDRLLHARITRGRVSPEDVGGQTHPERLMNDLAPLVMGPLNVSPSHLDRCVSELSALGNDPWYLGRPGAVLRTAWGTNETTHRVLSYFMRRSSGYDLVWLQLRGAGMVSRFFWRWHEPESFAPTDPRLLRQLARTVSAFHQQQDRILADLGERLGPDVILLVVSPSGTAPTPEHDLPRDGLSARRAGPGLLVAAGPDLGRDARIHYLSIYDLAPTLLGLLGLPHGQDMPGQPQPILLRSSYGIGSYGAFEPTRRRSPPPNRLDQELMRELGTLGYVN